VGTCGACEKNICAGHRRRWLGLTLCTRCHARTAPAWTVVLAAVLVIGFVVFLIVKWRTGSA
jgi:hypothetical protein